MKMIKKGDDLTPTAAIPASGMTPVPRSSEAEGKAFTPNPQDSLAAASPTPTPAPTPTFAQRGGTIGRYRLLELIGEGGFGEVWLAEQTEPVRRRVALKVIKPGMDSKAVIARFEAERQALAIMNHPNVAKVFDAGTTPVGGAGGVGGVGGGRPYFVMEYVKGRPITTYCDKHRLTIEQRLRLFMVVCDAVQHAHTKGIIHRDLKPSNILVAAAESGESGGSGTDGARPVVIDFGVAKALAGRLSDQTLHTQWGQIIGTLEYMSPEQAEMAEGDIDTRADVYSLGVILYELLTGAVPFDSKTLRDAGFLEIQRTIREEEPPRPSTRLSKLGDSAEGVSLASAAAAARHTRLEDLSAELRRELEWIPLKALRKERGERYRSAAEMADDVANYLAHRPLIAGPVSAGYRMRKFVSRHRGAAIGSVVIAASLVLAAGVSVWFGVRESAAAEKEAAARTRTEAINEFVTKALRSSDPSAGGRQDTTVAEAMQNAVAEIRAGAFKDDPETGAGLRETIATILRNNGRPAEAEPLFAEALEMNRGLHKGDHPAVAECLNNVAFIAQDLGRVAEAEPRFVEALEMRRRLSKSGGTDDPKLAASLNNLAFVRQALGRGVEAEPLYAEALEISRRVHTGDHADVARGLNNLGSMRRNLGRAAEAEPLLIEALEMRRRLYKGDHPSLAESLNNVASIRQAQGKPAEAEPYFAEALEINRRLFKGDHPDVARAMNNLGSVRLDLNQAAGAEPLFVEALEMRRRLFKVSGGDHPDVASSLGNLARAQHALGKAAEARQGFDASIGMLRRLAPGGSPTLARVLWRSGSARVELKEAGGRALAELEESATMATKFLPPGHPHLKEYGEAVEACRAAATK